nr:hypothetical protein [Acetatifactor sp.]
MDNKEKQSFYYTWKNINASLDTMRGMFDLVRLVDPEECREVFIDDSGVLSFGKECYAVWNASHRCADCTSLRACRTHQRKGRVEYYDGKKYQIQSIPIQIVLSNDTVYSCNIELINFSVHTLTDMEESDYSKDAKETHDYLTTHDNLTGILNWDGFCRHVRQLILDDPDLPRVIISANIRNFKLIN